MARAPDPKPADSAPAAVDITALTARLTAAVAGCTSEEDLRVETEHLLRDALPDLPQPKYEASVKTSTFTGRADAVHRQLVIEYKKPRLLRQAPKREEAIKQASDYVESLSLGDDAAAESFSQEQEEKLSGTVALATDGERFIFIQRRSKAWHADERKLDTDTVEKLLLWLRAMGRKDLSPENLILDFGPDSELAATTVRVLAALVHSRKYPKANVIYEEWRRIFGIVYGTEQLTRTRKAPESVALSAAYHLELGVEFPELLFAVHTYYALLMKMLATEVIVAQGGFGDSFISALTRTELREQLRELESGAILQRQNIRNAIEQDFFGWYPEAWTAELHKMLWQFAETIAEYDIGTFQLRPDRARDLLKDLYHGLIPDTVRHALGEYYTPDWLAEHTLQLSGYDGNPSRTLLDPSCGSGTFLVMAIQLVRQWLADHSVEWSTNKRKQEAVNLIRHNIVGFDLNPLAVIASRTNYLFALGPLLRYRSAGTDFEVPIYLTDSVLLPGQSKGADLFAQDTVDFPMTVGTFSIPREIVDERQVPDFMNLLHDSIAEGHSRESFVARSLQGFRLTDKESNRLSLSTLFKAMEDLDKAGKNRVWAKLIRNRYASLFFRHYFEFVVGNPPHVNWEALTPEWRSAAENEYRRYGLFSLSGYETQHGGGKKDIAALFTYAVLDHFLKTDGVLALVVHASLFKTSGAGEGYRRFQLGSGDYFGVDAAHDFQSFQPFQTRSKMKIKTRTVTIRAVKGMRTRYPVSYTTWEKHQRGFVPGNLTWEQAQQRLTPTTLTAVPLRGAKDGPLSPWLTISVSALAGCKKLIAPADYKPYYRGRAGLNTGGLNGAYFVEIVERLPNDTLRIRNLYDDGKILCPKVQAVIEADLVHPMLRGREVARWFHQSEGYVLILQDPKTQKGYKEQWLQTTHPLTWAYIRKFEKLLRVRKAFTKFFDTARDAFYSMYNISEHTFAPHKVVWMDVCDTVKACVVSKSAQGAMPIPEHKNMFAAVESEDEAHYLCAVMNSLPFRTIVSGYTVDNSVSTHPLENIVVHRFDKRSPRHGRLSALSQEAHAAARKKDTPSVERVEHEIDDLVITLY